MSVSLTHIGTYAYVFYQLLITLSTFDGQYLHKTLHEKASAYLFHLCQNHPFIDGNKRVAHVSALMFLSMNDCSIDYNERALEQLVRGVAEGEAPNLALFLNFIR